MRHKIKDYTLITIGCFIVSIGFVFFINPYSFVPGGVYGTSIVLHNLFPSLQVGTFGYMISIPLLIASWMVLGKGIGAKTLYATLITPTLMNTVSTLAYPTQEALNSLSPALICNGMLNLSNDLILACLIGPVLIGFGTGLIMRGHATSGGTDIVAMIIHKYLRVKFSQALLYTDATVILFGLLVFSTGLGSASPSTDSFKLAGYSLICIFILSRTLAYVVSGSKNNKLMFIVTKHDNGELREFVTGKLDRTGTVLNSTGLYSQESKHTLMMVVRMREVNAVTTQIKTFDPNAFVIVTDAYDAYGLRWKAFPDKYSIEIS